MVTLYHKNGALGEQCKNSKLQKAGWGREGEGRSSNEILPKIRTSTVEE